MPFGDQIDTSGTSNILSDPAAWYELGFLPHAKINWKSKGAYASGSVGNVCEVSGPDEARPGGSSLVQRLEQRGAETGVTSCHMADPFHSILGVKYLFLKNKNEQTVLCRGGKKHDMNGG